MFMNITHSHQIFYYVQLKCVQTTRQDKTASGEQSNGEPPLL